MMLWGVLCADAETSGGVPHDAAPLRDALEGLVVVPRHAPAQRSAVHRGAAVAGLRTELVAGLLEVPPEAELVALIDVAAIAPDSTDLVVRMRARLTDGTAAVVRGGPVTDALKRVDGARVLDGVDRSGLFVPQTPQILRRAALEDAVVRGPAHLTDPATLLAACGYRVDVLWGGAGES